MKRFVWLLPALYILFLLMPIYWLLNMSFKNTNEILGSFTLWPRVFTLENYRKIFTDPTWYGGYLNSLGYVLMNTVTSVVVALPAAYAFSRYRFLGDKHLFFWLLTNRMAPPAVFALPLAQTLTAVDAKPIAATMTRTASTSGYELGLLAAAGALTIIPGAFVIYFVRNYIAKGFALGRV